jgi:hypothetical protein
MTILTMNDELIAGKKWFWRLGTYKNALSVHQTVTSSPIAARQRGKMIRRMVWGWCG